MRKGIGEEEVGEAELGPQLIYCVYDINVVFGLGHSFERIIWPPTSSHPPPQVSDSRVNPECWCIQMVKSDFKTRQKLGFSTKASTEC
jgi:hypothetical protein